MAPNPQARGQTPTPKWQSDHFLHNFPPSSHSISRIRRLRGRGGFRGAGHPADRERNQLRLFTPEPAPHRTDPAALILATPEERAPTRTSLPQLCNPSQMWGAASQRHAPHPAMLPPPLPAAAAGLPGECCQPPTQPLTPTRLPAPRADASVPSVYPSVPSPATDPLCSGDGFPV